MSLMTLSSAIILRFSKQLLQSHRAIFQSIHDLLDSGHVVQHILINKADCQNPVNGVMVELDHLRSVDGRGDRGGAAIVGLELTY